MTPSPPSDFQAPEKALWRRSMAALIELGVWQDSDRDALERYCRASAMSRLARERIAKRAKTSRDGAYIAKGSMGQPVIAPDVELERRARLDADQLGRELGLTPAARKRIGADEPYDSDFDHDLAVVLRDLDRK
jgi:P27 family predicted phage terminase small subunit